MSTPFNASAELAALKHEKKNQNLYRLPPTATIRRRPLNHTPVANLRSGAKVPKVVYVSRRTPLISAIKRVKKFLLQVEKRALLDAGVRMGSKDRTKKIIQANEQLAKSPEEVLVKASGRAMEQALRVGEWFRNKEKAVLCKVEVRAGSVSVVDDIVEVEEDNERKESGSPEESKMQRGETTLAMLGDNITGSAEQDQTPIHEEYGAGQGKTSLDTDMGDASRKKTRRKKKRKRPVYEEDDLPEARLRWVKTVEVAISLRT
ncbi:uncharacterized protein Z518_05876 [Rhinocladiella mackenziei CBS 650.93]|uniref:Rhinocladiella mackenziei CBS 650.93 unplaced genomic scaffold supercont1.4, whole genome shotgun sequence n=1 Tax=Rhinocladiella mackenziei CBS 650.93 TaxID=1442369 RepID=A0A0D2IGY6_9EURO|nr:uncharacterized protein Z518_05876 [Rhinocladiella mackenziei CBS 650.93]KIX05004.1 hypothetical protein Z518_05876 [Rhinocladiella mackenziei CBS 650.93]